MAYNGFNSGYNNRNYNRNNRGNNYNGNRETPSYLPYKELTDDNYVNQAETIVETLFKGRKVVTTSQIRNLLSLNSEIYNMVIAENKPELSETVQSKLQYLKVRMVYDSGRESTVNDLVQNAQLIKHIDAIGNSRKKYITFARFMEALVAYRKFIGVREGKKDN